MIASILLVGFGVVLAALGPWLVGRLLHSESVPTLGVAAWLTASAAALLSFGAGAALLCRYVWTSTSGLDLLERCLQLLAHARTTEPVALAGVAGLLALLVGTGRLAWCGVRHAWSAGSARHAQRQSLALLAHPHASETGVHVVDQAQVAAFCLPRRGRGEVYVTRAALELLSPVELVAVLEHERAHLRGRHALAVSVAAMLRAAFPFVPLFRAAAAATPRLVEMAADDAAARRTDRKTVASALLRLAEASAPAGAFGAGGATVINRARRLVSPADPLSGFQILLAGGLALSVLTGPLAVGLLAPAAACPFAMS